MDGFKWIGKKEIVLVGFNGLHWILVDSDESGIKGRAAFISSIKFNLQSCCQLIVQLTTQSFELAQMDSKKQMEPVDCCIRGFAKKEVVANS